MNGFNDKALQAIWDGLGLPADIKKQEEFERLVYEWADDNERSVCCRDCKFGKRNGTICRHKRFAERETEFDIVYVEPNSFCASVESKEG